MRQDPANRVGIQRGIANPTPHPQYGSFEPADRLFHTPPPAGLERKHQAGLGLVPAGQADFRPLPTRSVFLGLIRNDKPPARAIPWLASAVVSGATADDRNILHVEGHEFATAQGVREQ